MMLKEIFSFLIFLFLAVETFAVSTPASCRGVNISSYINENAATPDKAYRFQALSRQLKTSLTSNANVNCYNDLYQSALRDHSSYWADRLQEEGCSINDRGQVSGYCPSSGEAQRSITEVSNIDRALKEDASDMLEDSQELKAEARGAAATKRDPTCDSRTGAAYASQLHDQLCCGSPTSNAGVIRGIERISYNTCIGKIRPTNRSIASAGGALSCLVNAVKAAATTIWESITSILRLPGEIWAARAQIWALITKPAARAQFARVLMNQLKHFFTDRVEAFKCYNEYEKAQYLCRLGGQIIITCAMPQTFGAFIGLAAKPLGQAAKIIGTMLSKSPRGNSILGGIKSGTQASLRAARAAGSAAARADNATGNVVSRGARAGEAVVRTIGRPLSIVAERVARRIETSSSYRNMLATAYRAERRAAAENATLARAAARADSDVAPPAPAAARTTTTDAPDTSATPVSPNTPDAPATVAAAPREVADAPAATTTAAPREVAPVPSREVASAPVREVASSSPAPVAAAPRAITPREASVPITAPSRNVSPPPQAPAPARVAAPPIRQEVSVPRTVTRAPETAGPAIRDSGGAPNAPATIASTASAPPRLAASGSGIGSAGGGGGFASAAAPSNNNLNLNQPAAGSVRSGEVTSVAPSVAPVQVNTSFSGASAAPASASRAPAAAAAREVNQVAAVQTARRAESKFEIEAPDWTPNEHSKFAAVNKKPVPTLDSRNTSVISGLKSADEVTASFRDDFGSVKTKRVTVAELLDEASSSRVANISVTQVHLPAAKVSPAVRAKIEPELLTRTDIVDARVEFASGEVGRFAGSREQLARLAASNNVKSAVRWDESAHIAPPITKIPEANRAAGYDPVAARYATIPKENITTTKDSDLSGATIMHGTSSNFRASVEKGPRDIGRGYGGDGLYTTMDDGFEYAKLYADKARKEWKNRVEWDGIKPDGGDPVSEVMVGTINPNRNLKVGVFEIRRDGVTDISRGILSGQDWPNDAVLRRTLKENFDVLDLRGAARNQIPGLPDRMLIFSERAGADAIVWKPRGTKPPMPVAKVLNETADADSSIASAVVNDAPTSRGSQIVNRILKQQGKTPDELRSVVIRNASRSDTERKAAIRREFPQLNRMVKDPKTGGEINLVDAIVDDVHRIGGRRHGAGVFNYTPEEIAAKARRLREYGVSAADREALIRLGHAGDLPPTAELAAKVANSAKLSPAVQKRFDNLNLRAVTEKYNEVKPENRYDDELERTQVAVNRRINTWQTSERESALKFLEGLDGKTAAGRRDNYFAAIINAPPGKVGDTVARLQRAEGPGTARQKVLSEIDSMLDAKTDEIFALEKAGDQAAALAAARSRSALEFERAIIEHRDDIRVVNIFDANAHNDYTSAVKKRRPHSTDDTFSVDVEVTSNKFKACRGSYASLTSSSAMHGGYLSLCRSSNYLTRKEILQLSAAPSDKNLPEPEAGYSRFNRFDVKKGARFSIGQNRDVIYDKTSGDAIADTGGKGGGIEIFCARSTNCVKPGDLGASVRVPSCDRRKNPLCEKVFQIQESVRAGVVSAKMNPTAHLKSQLAETNNLLSSMSKDVDAYYNMFIYDRDTAALTNFRTKHPELVSALNLRDEITLKMQQAERGNLDGLDADTAAILQLDRGLSGFEDRLVAATSRSPSSKVTAKDLSNTITRAIDADPGAKAVVSAYRAKLGEIERQKVYLKTHPPTTPSEEIRRLGQLNLASAQKNDVLLQLKNLEFKLNSRIKKLGANLSPEQRAEVERNVLRHITGG